MNHFTERFSCQSLDGGQKALSSSAGLREWTRSSSGQLSSQATECPTCSATPFQGGRGWFRRDLNSLVEPTALAVDEQFTRGVSSSVWTRVCTLADHRSQPGEERSCQVATQALPRAEAHDDADAESESTPAKDANPIVITKHLRGIPGAGCSTLWRLPDTPFGPLVDDP